MSRYLELLEQQARLTEQIEAARAEEAAGAAKTCRELIERYGLTPLDVGFVKTQQIPTKNAKRGDRTFATKHARGPQPPLYRDPATGATWSGRGKTPRWLTGKDRDEFLIRDNEAA